ncbi:protein SPT2 homolog [Electrophorus electricus]|uniref:Protein SPT2 homolog n=1 Tax=Electrophorus electricus TaxID=8005 RepID=A0A4W4HJ79_ELEEL|nr:protein SPT2 homolog [Electrophorus electricus]
MDFDNVLSIASQNQGVSGVQKRYSLKPGPPKKDPKVKGVNSAAVQAFLKKQEVEHKKKELEKKRQKDDLLAKRVELKSDRKARAMASRTKDNFRGYNGIPVVDQPKKKQSKTGNLEERQDFSDAYDEDNYEYVDSNSECEQETVPVRPQARIDGPSKNGGTQRKNIPAKAARPCLNFADLLKLAEKKQFEPVELKPTKKIEERLRTADEIKELEFERKVKKQDKGKDSKADKSSGLKNGKSSSNSHKKSVSDRDNREGKSHKSSVEKPPSGISKMPKSLAQSERLHSSAKLSHGNGSKPSSSFSRALSGKATMTGGTLVSVKQAPSRPQSGQKLTTSSDLTSKKGYPGLPQEKASGSGSRPVAASNPSRLSNQAQGIKVSGQVRPSQGNSSKGPPQKLGKGDLPRSVGSAPPRPGSSGPIRAAPGGFSKQAGMQQPRPGGGLQGRSVPPGARPSENGPSRPGWGVPARPLNSMGPGPGRPQCTVVSETISSKNFAPKSEMTPRPLVPQGPRTIIGPTGHRILVRPPGPVLPPITSSYKRKCEDEEDYDPEMDDFIDDEGEDQDEISKHIREIFGYDRNKYKDESDYALKFMESSWKEQQKEEARSLRLGIKEDEEEMRMEEEEMKRKQEMKAKRRKT